MGEKERKGDEGVGRLDSLALVFTSGYMHSQPKEEEKDHDNSQPARLVFLAACYGTFWSKFSVERFGRLFVA